MPAHRGLLRSVSHLAKDGTLLAEPVACPRSLTMRRPLAHLTGGRRGFDGVRAMAAELARACERGSFPLSRASRQRVRRTARVVSGLLERTHSRRIRHIHRSRWAHRRPDGPLPRVRVAARFGRRASGQTGAPALSCGDVDTLGRSMDRRQSATRSSTPPVRRAE